MSSLWDFFFYDQTNPWIWQPLVGVIMGQIWCWAWLRITGPPRNAAPSPVDFSGNRFPLNRPEISTKPGVSSLSGDVFGVFLFLSTLFYFQHRPLYLTVFAFVVWLGWSFTFGVCIWLTRNQKWSGQPYGWAISGLVIGCVILFLGGAFAQDPPEKLPSVNDFLTSGSSTVPEFGLFTGSIWVILHFFGIIFTPPCGFVIAEICLLLQSHGARLIFPVVSLSTESSIVSGWHISL
jgi:hypothetical protein